MSRGVLSPHSERPYPALASQDILQELERANLFVVPLDNKGCWYRYHHLFADLLRQRLEQTQPEKVAVLHGRAGAWCEQNGLVEEAIEHALAAGDLDWAIALVEREAESTVMRSELETLKRWIQALPPDRVRVRPLLCVFDTWAILVGGGSMEAVQARLQDVIDADTTGAFAGEVLAVRALLAAFQHKTRESKALSQRALDLLPRERTFFRSFIAGYLGLNYMYSGDLDAARRAFEEAVRLAQEIGNVMNAVLGLVHLAELSAIEGHVRQAEATYERALDLAVNGNGKRLPVAGVALTGLGRLLQLSNQLEEAQRCIDEGLELVHKWAEAGAIGGYVGRAFVRQAYGDEPGARAAIQIAEDLALRFDAMQADDDYVATNKAALSLLQGDLDQAERWAADCELDIRPGASLLDERDSGASVPLNRVYEYLTLGRLRLAQGRYAEALAILRSLHREVEAAGWNLFCIRTLVLESLALHHQGRSRQALEALGRALALAEPGNYVRVFVDEGPPMARLLYQAAAQGLSTQFAGKLLVEFENPGSRHPVGAGQPSGPRGAGADPDPETLVEPLSQRELQVLTLISEGLTNREVAQRLHVSLSTVKVHTYNMYGKLDVHNRTQAVARARVLGLLEPF